MKGKKGRVLVSLVACLLFASAGVTGVMGTNTNSNSVEGTTNVMTKPAIVVEAPHLDVKLNDAEYDSGAMAIAENKQELIYSVQVENGDEYMDSSFNIRNNSTDALVAAITVEPKSVIKGVEIGFANAGVVRIAPNKWLVGPIGASSADTVKVQIDVSPLAELGLSSFKIKVTPTKFTSLEKM